MKINRIIFALLALGGAFLSSCSKASVADEAAVDITADYFGFDRNGVSTAGTSTSTVSCNYDWVAYPSDSWIKVSPSSGSANVPVDVTVSVLENKKYSQRKGAVNFFDGSMLSKRACAVSQEESFFEIDEEERYVEFTYDVTSYEFTVNSNASWTISSDNASYVPDAVSGKGTKKIKVSFPTNMGEDVNRVAIIVKADLDEADNADTVIIYHKCFEYYVDIPKEAITANYYDTKITFKIDANTPWTASSLSEGVTITPATGSAAATMTVALPYNETLEAREFKVKVLADKTGLKSPGGEIVITQGPCYRVPFGTVWGKTFLDACVEAYKKSGASKPMGTFEGITFVSSPSSALTTTNGFKGNMEFYFFAAESGDASMTFSNIETAKGSTESSKCVYIKVNGVNKASFYSAQVMKSDVTLTIGQVEAGDKITFKSQGSGSYNYVKPNSKSGVLFDFTK